MLIVLTVSVHQLASAVIHCARRCIRSDESADSAIQGFDNETIRGSTSDDEALSVITSAPSSALLADSSATSSTSTEAATVSSIGDDCVKENESSDVSAIETSREADSSPITVQLEAAHDKDANSDCVSEGVTAQNGHKELPAEASKNRSDEVEKQQAELILTLREEVSNLNRKVLSLQYDVYYYECLDKTATFKEAKSKQTITAMEGEIQVLRSLVNELSSKASIQSTSERAIGHEDSRGQLDQATERQMPKRLFSSTSSYDPDSISFSESLSCDSHSELSMADIEVKHISESAESCASSSEVTKEDSKAAEVLTQSSAAVEIVKVHKKRCCLM